MCKYIFYDRVSEAAQSDWRVSSSFDMFVAILFYFQSRIRCALSHIHKVNARGEMQWWRRRQRCHCHIGRVIYRAQTEVYYMQIRGRAKRICSEQRARLLMRLYSAYTQRAYICMARPPLPKRCELETRAQMRQNANAEADNVTARSALRTRERVCALRCERLHCVRQLIDLAFGKYTCLRAFQIYFTTSVVYYCYYYYVS